jgi:hypothetical protein
LKKLKKQSNFVVYKLAKSFTTVAIDEVSSSMFITLFIPYEYKATFSPIMKSNKRLPYASETFISL